MEPVLQKKYPWYSEERCCVKYLTQEKINFNAKNPQNSQNAPNAIIEITQPMQKYNFDENYIREHYQEQPIQEQQIKNILLIILLCMAQKAIKNLRKIIEQVL